MSRILVASLVFLLAAATHAAAPATTSPSTGDRTPVLSHPVPADAPPAPVTPPQITEPPAERMLSPTTSSRLVEAATAKASAPASGDTVAAGADKPRNTIFRLPAYEVQEPKISLPKERGLLTPKGRLDLALSRHPGLKFGPFSWLNNAVALAMLEEDEKIERQQEMIDLVSILNLTNDPAREIVQRDVQRSFLRSNEWIGSGGAFNGH